MLDEKDITLLYEATKIALLASKMTPESDGLIVVPDHFNVANLQAEIKGWTSCEVCSVSNLWAQETKFASAKKWPAVCAVDVFDDATDLDNCVSTLKSFLSESGTLILIQPNRPLRRGIMPKSAGGPERSLSYYELRSLAERSLAPSQIAVINLDAGITLHPVTTAASSDTTTAPSQSVGFALIHGGEASFSSASGPLADELPTKSAELAVVSPAIARGERRKLAFVIDVRDWAYANIVSHIEPALVERYDVTRYYLAEYDNKAELLLDLFVRNQYDNIQFMWREFFFNSFNTPNRIAEVIRLSGLSSADLAKRFSEPVLTTTIYDHLFLTEPEIEQRQSALLLIDGYSVSSGLLEKIYQDAFLKKPCIITPDGVNTPFFLSCDPQAIKKEGTFRVGWVGNSSWGEGNSGVGEDPKGLHSILAPAVEELKAEGCDIELVLADRNLRSRDRDEMRAYYCDEIDVLVCSSVFEGTPNPVLEAMASGCPFISTDVGIVREVSGPKQAEFIMQERSIVVMVETLRRMMGNHKLRGELAEENRNRAINNDWSTRVDSWTQLFAIAEHEHIKGNQIVRREILQTKFSEWENQKNRTGTRQASMGLSEIASLRAKLQKVRAAADKHRDTIKTLRLINADLLPKATALSSPSVAKTTEVVLSDVRGTQNKLDALQAEYGDLVQAHGEISEQAKQLEWELAEVNRTTHKSNTAQITKNTTKRIVGLDNWILTQQKEMQRKDHWNQELQARVVELEEWSHELQQLLKPSWRSVLSSARNLLRGQK